MRLKLSAILLLALFLPGLAHALGLGQLKLESTLNQPFEARVELLSATRDELDSLNIGLADEEAFRRAGIERSYILTQLRFGIRETEDGPDYIRIYSQALIREPFLNFLLEASWSKGRLFREYTVLLDPPIYAPAETRKPIIHPEIPSIDTTTEDQVVVFEPGFIGEAPMVAPGRPVDYTGGDYGPTVTGDTLWSIAKAMRPDRSVSIQQMMLALMRANPEAFINGNINGLKRGEVLRLPEISDMQLHDKQEAFNEALAQNNLWQEARGAMATVVTPRVEGLAEKPEEIMPEVAEEPVPEAAEEMPEAETAVEGVTMVPEQEMEGEAELRLVAPTEEGEGADQSAMDAAAAETEAMTRELALATESTEVLKLENAELADKLTEAEGIASDLERLIVLKEDELATIQQQIVLAQAEPEISEVTAEAPDITEAVTEAEVEEAVEELMAEEEVTEEEAVAEAEVEMPPAPSGVMAVIDSIIKSLMGIVGQLKSNLMMIAGGLGALIAIAFLALFAMRRRKKSDEDISEFPDFEDFVDEPGDISEDATDIKEAQAESEAPTAIPGSEDETVPPVFGADEDQTQIVAPAGGQVAEEPAEEEEEDPMAEVNVFLAYEHFDQAEDFVRQALEKEPDNLEFHSKLLEVFYAANNKKAYEDIAQVLHDKIGGPQGEHWEMAVAMWQELSPNRALFEASADGEEPSEEPAADTGGGILDLTETTGDGADLGSTADAGEEVLDVTAAADLDVEEVTEEPSEEAASLEFDMGEEESAPESEEVLDLTESDGGVDPLDVSHAAEDDLLDVTAAVGLEEEPEEEESSELDTGDGSLDISFGDEPVAEESDVLDIGADEALDLSFDAEPEAASGELDAGDGSLDISFGDEPVAEESAALDTGADEGLDLSFDAEPEAGDASVDSSLEASDELLDVTAAVSLDEELEEEGADEESLDISFGDEPVAEESGAAEIGADEALDLSFDAEPEAGDASVDSSLEASDELLDVTAAVSLDEELEEEGADEESLDISFGDEPAAEESAALDIGADEGLDLSLDAGEDPLAEISDGGDADVDGMLDIAEDSNTALDSDSDVLDVSKTSADDLLDVTASASFEPDSDEDLLDVTVASDGMAHGGGGLLDTEKDSSESDSVLGLDVEGTDSEPKGGGSDLDLSLGIPDMEEDPMSTVKLEPSSDSEAPEDVSAADDDSMTFDIGLDVSEGGGATEEGLDLDLQLDAESADDKGLSDLEMNTTMEIPKSAAEDVIESAATSEPSEEEFEVDMEATVQAPQLSISMDDDDEQKTVLVKRASESDEQSAEDEIGTQLDLAKAYIELGDNDNAKTILDEVIAQGNDEQKQQAQELLGQIT